jgi:predicted enzyme related to lactoylglutathione lyase
MANNGQIDYIEFPAPDLPRTKTFYSRLFGWKFTDYGTDYTSFEDGRIAGGFWNGSGAGPLVVIYAAGLAAMEAQVRAEGGIITKGIFEFPGGRRFHFRGPDLNELAVWSDK